MMQQYVRHLHSFDMRFDMNLYSVFATTAGLQTGKLTCISIFACVLRLDLSSPTCKHPFTRLRTAIEFDVAPVKDMGIATAYL